MFEKCHGDTIYCVFSTGFILAHFYLQHNPHNPHYANTKNTLCYQKCSLGVSLKAALKKIPYLEDTMIKIGGFQIRMYVV